MLLLFVSNSVTRERRVGVGGPRLDAAGQVEHRREARSREEPRRESAPHAVVAYDDEVAVARQFAEAKLKADDLLAAVQTALNKLGPDISESDRAEVEALVQDVESAIALKSAPALKKANDALDHGTEHLAALLIEQAMR